MFHIVLYNVKEGWKEIWKTTSDPCIAYDLAHMLHAKIVGVGDSDELCIGTPPFAKGGFSFTIEDENGVDMWQYCSRMRCRDNFLCQPVEE